MSDQASSSLDHRGMEALAELYHRYLTGLILALVVDRGEDRAVDAVFGLFRRQHLDKFLPGLGKLGLRGMPDAVACAQYHYLSNSVGGVPKCIPSTLYTAFNASYLASRMASKSASLAYKSRIFMAA